MKDSCGKYTGYIQISGYFSSDGKFAKLQIVLKIVDVLLFDGSVTGKAVSLVHDAGILGEVCVRQFEIYRLGVFLFMERILVPYPLERNRPWRRKHPYLIFVPVIVGGILDVFDLHIEVLMELVIQSVVVLFGEKYSGSQALVCDCTETAHRSLENEYFRLRTAEKCHAKERAAVPALLAFLDQDNKLLFVSFRTGDIKIVEIPDVIVARCTRVYVLPVPGPAVMRTGPSAAAIAFRCPSFAFPKSNIRYPPMLHNAHVNY